MAIKIFERYSPRANAPTTNYPSGSIKNQSVPGANDGTPLEADWGNDYAGFDAALLDAAGIEPSGTPDTAVSSQRLTAMTALYGNDVKRVQTIADASALTGLAAGQQISVAEYNAGTGKGGGTLIFKAGAATPNNVKIFASASSSGYLERIDETVTSYTAGIDSDNQSTDYTSRIIAASAIEDDIELFGDINLASAQASQLADINFSGDAELLNTPRKYSAPILAPSPRACASVVPSSQLKQLNRDYKPRVVIVGDSISTYQNNVWARGDGLAGSIQQSLEKQFPAGITFLERAISGSGFSELFSTNYADTDYLPWYQGMPTTRWIDVVEQDTPDLLIVAFGMNDHQSASVNTWANLKAEIATWTKVPDIVVVTNPVPNANFGSEQVGGQFGRDMAAGLSRTWAIRERWALLDFHRMQCQSRDGFDPVSAVIYEPLGVVLSGTSYTGKLCSHFKFRVTINGAMTNGSSIRFPTGRGSADFIVLTKADAGNININAYCGRGAVGVDDAIAYVGQNIPFTWPATSFDLTVELDGGKLRIYREDDPKDGGYAPNIYELDILALGGDFEFYLAWSGHTPSALRVGYGHPMLNKPSVRNGQLFNGYEIGGSTYNHPSGYYASHIMRPVLDLVQWKTERRKSGRVAVAAGASSVDISIGAAEPDGTFKCRLQAQDGSLGSSTAYSIIAFDTVRVFFYPVTVFAGNLDWELYDLS